MCSGHQGSLAQKEKGARACGEKRERQVRPEGMGEQDSREVGGNRAKMDRWDLPGQLDLGEMLAHQDSVCLADLVALARPASRAWMDKKEPWVSADSLAIPAFRADLDAREKRETKVSPGWTECPVFQEKMESPVRRACREKKVAKALLVGEDFQESKALKVPWVYRGKRV